MLFYLFVICITANSTIVILHLLDNNGFCFLSQKSVDIF